MKKILFNLILLLFMAGLSAYSILESQSGDIITNLDARNAAMGNTGVVGTGRLFEIFMNPSNLTTMQSKTGFQVGLNLINNTDNRSLPMYNSFDAYSGEGTYVSNDNLFADLSLAAFYKYQMTDINLAAALSFSPRINFSSDYFEEVRNNGNSDENGYPPVLASNFLESEGNINAVALTLAAEYKNFLQVGFEIAQFTGESQWEREINWSEYSIEKIEENPDTMIFISDYYSKLDRDFEAIGFSIGANVKINERLKTGFSFAPKVEYDVSGSLITKIDSLAIGVNEEIYHNVQDAGEAVYVYFAEADSLGNPVYTDSIMYDEFIAPTRMRVGINFQPRNIMKTFFNVDVEMVNWSEVNDLYEDEFNFYVGIEHNIRHSIPIRLGFSYQTEYGLHTHNGFLFADKISKPSFTAGTGFKLLERFTVDIGLQYSFRKYEALDLFNDNYYWNNGDFSNLWVNPQYLNIQDRGWENPDTVKERFVNLKTSISFNW